MSVRVPVATYRVQFNRDFAFKNARDLVEYFRELGISDLYASPIFKAREGSTHGYDVTDPTQFNPELGTEQEFEDLCSALRAHDMGLLLDIVPNHMAACSENPWWVDVLEKGKESRYASFFDVNWESEKILLPLLSKPHGEAIEQHEIELKVVNGRPSIVVNSHPLPLGDGAPHPALRATLSQEERVRFIDAILSKQHYRLAYWRKASDSIAYRRFFDINDLIGLRTESEEVFQATHALAFKLLAEGKVTGLRIDHIDGLWDPKAYLEKLPAAYVVVEKILGSNERLRCDWRVQGTTGYDFLNAVNAAFVDPAGYRQLEKIYQEFTGSPCRRIDVFRDRKTQVMTELFGAEVNALVNRLGELAEKDRNARDLSSHELRDAFVRVTANLSVYRTYVRDFKISDADRAIIEDALALAGKSRATDFLRAVLLLEPAWYLKNQRDDYLDFVMRWQQFTGPVMAKGLEDTTFYVHNPLISVNEVGSDCTGPEVSFGVEEFHRQNAQRRNNWPATMNASSTHDTKRSEDVRARINTLSEMPAEWARCLRRWSRLSHRDSAPSRNEQILIFQSLLGAWPIENHRFKQFVTKALREAKTNSSWTDVNEAYEKQVLEFVDRLFESEVFLKELERLHKKVAYYGHLSSLSQTLLKMTSPGVPDFYRGTELWDFSLADPDNRRPLDFGARKRALAAIKKAKRPTTMVRRWADGRIKMFIIWKTLEFRASAPDLFNRGEYISLRVTGAHADHIIAFARKHASQWALIAAPRLLAKIARPGTPPLGEKIWSDTRVELPAEAPKIWINRFSGETLDRTFASALFSTFPTCLASGHATI